jgi:uncharacterized membrane protein YfcA
MIQQNTDPVKSSKSGAGSSPVSVHINYIFKPHHRKIVAQSILIWILAILIATGMHLYNDNGNKYTYQASLYIIIVAIGLYMIVGAKLAWKKCKFFKLKNLKILNFCKTKY